MCASLRDLGDNVVAERARLGTECDAVVALFRLNGSLEVCEKVWP